MSPSYCINWSYAVAAIRRGAKQVCVASDGRTSVRPLLRLHKRAKLKRLSISVTVEDSNADQLGVALSKFTELKALTLIDCEISDAAFAAFVAHLPSFPTLECFCFEDEKFSDEMAKVLADVIPRCAHLHALEVDCGRISIPAVRRLVAAIHRCSSLTYVSIEANGLRSADRKWLETEMFVFAIRNFLVLLLGGAPKRMLDRDGDHAIAFEIVKFMGVWSSDDE